MLHYCLRHDVMFGNYRRHMDDAHDGRSDCVLSVTPAQGARILAGESIDQARFARPTLPQPADWPSTAGRPYCRTHDIFDCPFTNH